MALTAQKVALMVLMLGLLMMGVTVMALAGDAPLPTGRESFKEALTKSPYIEVKAGYHPVSQKHFGKLNSDYVHPATTEAVASDETELPQAFEQPLY